jgi:hypothetical protein
MRLEAAPTAIKNLLVWFIVAIALNFWEWLPATNWSLRYLEPTRRLNTLMY